MFPHEHNPGCECAKFYLIQDNYRLSYKAKQQYPKNFLQWDPWPVRQHRGESLLGHIQALVAARNETSSDHAMDAIDILPASPYCHGIQDGSIELYSIRSPSMLPIRVHIWEIPGGKVLLRRGLRTQLLSSFLNDLGCFEWKDEIARLKFWKSVPLRDQFMAMANPPQNLFRKVSLAWHAANPFRLLDLPAELREIVLFFALDIRLDPTGQCRLPDKIALCYTAYPGPSSRLKLRVCPNTSLLFVNKQIHQEVRAALSANVMIRFRDSNNLCRFLEQDFHTIPYFKRTVRSIQLGFREGREFLDLFGAPSNKPREFEYYNEAGFKLRTLMDADDLALKGISVDFPWFGRLSKPKHHCEGRIPRRVCQHALNEDILIGARLLLCKVRLVELTGNISTSQRERWLNVIMEDRKNPSMNPEKLFLWQQEAWNIKSAPATISSMRCQFAEIETVNKHHAPAVPSASRYEAFFGPNERSGVENVAKATISQNHKTVWMRIFEYDVNYLKRVACCIDYCRECAWSCIANHSWWLACPVSHFLFK